MGNDRDLVPWEQEELPVESLPPRQVELLTAQFYDWERRGRGWKVYPYPVELEPPFVPFRFHWIPPSRESFDDGKRPTVLSAITEGIQRLFTRQPRAPSWYDRSLFEQVEPELEPFEDDSPVAEVRITLPPTVKISREATEQCLLGLPTGSRPICFEVLGCHEEITLQFACHRGEAAKISQHLKAYFPDSVVTLQEESLQRIWFSRETTETVVVDFGLSEEFMLPVRTFRSFDIDPLTGVFAALSDLAPDEVGLLQILFQPVKNPWASSIVRAVLDDEGSPFFLDAPEIAKLAKEKVSRPLYAVLVRVAAKSPSAGSAWEIAQSLGFALGTLSNPPGNELIPLSNDGYPDTVHEENVLRRLTNRSGMILSSDELVSLVHLPSASVRVEKLKREERKTKAAPAITRGHELVLGVNIHAGKAAEVSLSADQRTRHMYVVGASGTGKSTLLLNLIVQDLKNGQGIAVLDPHGDLIDQVMGHVPEQRLDDVVLIDPADAEWPVGFNILSARTELEKTLLSSDLVAVFRRLSTSWGDQMTAVLGNVILACLENPKGGTLVDLRRFLVEKEFRESFLREVQDPDIVYYWRKEFPLLHGKPQAPILTRLDTFLRPKLIRYMVAQKEDRIDYRGIMDEGKILLVKLSQGAIGEENAHLMGTLLVSKLHQVAMSRQEVAESHRRPFYLYIDEFHNFVTPSMAQILSGARKYRLGLILAHQDLRQLASRSPEVLSSVLSNPATRICFRVGDQDARTLQDGLSSFEAKDLQSLGIGQAICRVERSDFDFNLDTPRVPAVSAEVAKARRDRITERSREKYARRREEIEPILRDATVERVVERKPAAPREMPRPVTHEPPPALVRKPAVPKPSIREAVPAPADIAPPLPGRGGPQHKYMQELLRRWAEAHGWRATIEERILDGLGSVDIALRNGERSVACEIAVTTEPAHEVENLKKCLAAGFERVLLVSAEKKTLNKIRQLAATALPEDDRKRVHFCDPDESFAVLQGIEAEAMGGTRTVRGYKVKVRYKAVAEKDKMEKRKVVSHVIAKAMKRLNRK